jgi:hypothetical protein
MFLPLDSTERVQKGSIIKITDRHSRELQQQEGFIGTMDYVM